MTEQRESSDAYGPDHPPAIAPATNRAVDAAPINPYQAPAYHADEGSGERSPRENAGPSVMFVVLAGTLMAAGALITVVSQGLGLPLLLAAVGGTIRASAISNIHKGSKRPQVAPEVLLFTSSLVTLLLMFCSATAFVTICTAGVLATSGPSAASLTIWSTFSGLAALVAFVLMFIRSLKWAA